jgi:hypothetical protein
MSTLYDTDFYAWTQEQIELLKHQKWNFVDTINIIEEIADLGKSVRKELISRLGVLLGHLLKWQFQPEHRTNSWLATIREQRRKIVKLLEENPSLQSFLPEALLNGYEDGLDLAVRETNLPYENFPAHNPYTLEQTLNPEFFPESRKQEAEG